MKKLMLSMMFCIGVGMAMMASPAQGCGDDNTVKSDRIQSATRVLNQEKARILYDRNAVKHDIMKRQASERKAPKRGNSVKQNGNATSLGNLRAQLDATACDPGANSRVGKGPVVYKPGGTAHTNSLPGGLSGKIKDR